MFLAPVRMYAARPRRFLSAPSASRIISASSPAPAMTAKCSPLIRPRSSGRRAPCNPTVTAAAMSFGMPRFDANRFAVPAGMIARSAFEPRNGVDAPLHHAVAAPHEHDVGAGVECFVHASGGELRLRHFEPQRIAHAVHAQLVTQLVESASERLARMRNHCDSAHRDLFPKSVPLRRLYPSLRGAETCGRAPASHVSRGAGGG